MQAFDFQRIKVLNKYFFFSRMDYIQYRNVSSGTWVAMHENTTNYVQVMYKHDKINPFTPKTEEKILNFILQHCHKQTAPHESTGQ